MKKSESLIVILYLGLLLLSYQGYSQKPHYYYFDKVIELTENPKIRYIDLVNDVSAEKTASLREKLQKFGKESQYGTNKYTYTVTDCELMDSVLKIADEFQDIISLNSMQYQYDSLTILVPQRMVFVKLKQGVSSLENILDSLNISYLELKKDELSENCYCIIMDYDDALNVSSLLYNTGYFEYAEPDFYSSTQLSGYESNPLFLQQWSVHNDSMNIGLSSAWDITTGHDSIKIALLDVGVSYTHPDLRDNMLPGYSAITQNFGYEYGSPNHDLESHGTLCAGIMVAENNDIGGVGVAHSSKLISIKCSEILPTGAKGHYPHGCDHIYHHHLLNAFYAADFLNADIITITLTNRHPSSAITDRISYLCQNGRNGKGIVFVVSSGNNEDFFDPDTVMSSFAKHPDVISVGSIAPTGLRSDSATNTGWFCFSSCYGEALDLVAPGELIPTTDLDPLFSNFAGTSAAAAHVAGVAALILSVNPCFTSEEVSYILKSTCQKIRPDIYTYDSLPNHPYGTWNLELGYGLVDAFAALSLAQQMSGYSYVKDTIFNTNSDWHGNRMVNKNIVIDSLATLTIYDTVFIANKSRIVVRPGGKLVVDGGTLTSACDGEMWQGIEVVGDRTKSQTATNQGVVELRNGAAIENAWCGIRTGLRKDTVTFATTGGIITADSATFCNNKQSVVINSYSHTALSGNISNYSASFTRCTFTIDTNNLFAANNTAFAEHVRLWDVKGIPFKGCVFENRATDLLYNGRGIYAEDAGLHIDTYCSVNYFMDCKCPSTYTDSCAFTGFNTAVEVNATGNPYDVAVNQAQFSGNGTGVYINGNNFATVTRCDFDLTTWPEIVLSNYGLYLNGCTGYKVEENTFMRTTYPTGPLTVDNSTGICVKTSGIANNSLYRNIFEKLTKGIHVIGQNGFGLMGLRMTCNHFSQGKYDIYIAPKTVVAGKQGSSSKGADNTFAYTQNSSFYNLGWDTITYYYKNFSDPIFPYRIVPSTKTTANSCSSTLCNGGGGSYMPLSSFSSQIETYVTAVGNANTDGTDMDGVETQDFASLQQALSESYYTAVRALMTDSLLDLAALEQWHTAAQPIADPYSLAETRFCEGYAETFAGNADDAELANYAEFHAMKLALRNQNDNADNQNNNHSSNLPNSPTTSPSVNWYAMTPAQIAQLQTIAERNTGRASVMAKGVLCFFFDICYEDDNLLADEDGDADAGTRAKHTAIHTADDAALTVHPNPASDLLHIELSGTEIATVALYDLQGRVVETRHGTSLQGPTATMNVRNIPAGVYVLRVTGADGREHHRKIVKK